MKSVSSRVILYIILFSSLVTLVVSAYQLYDEYQHELGYLQRGLDSVRDNFRDSIREAVWVRDMHQLEALVRGVVELRDIEYVEITDESGTLIRQGKRDTDNGITRVYPLTYEFRGEDRNIGSVVVVASKSRIFDHLYERILTILVSNAIKTFLVAVFALFIFNRLVSGRLASLSAALGQMQAGAYERLELSSGHDKDHYDEIDEVIVAFNNLQERLRTVESDLANQVRRFRLVADFLPAVILYADTDGTIRFANQTMSEWNRTPLEDIVGKTLGEVISNELVLKTGTRRFQAALLGERQEFSFHNDYADGVSRAIQASLVPHRDGDGHVLGIVMLLVDVTERELLEQQLRQSQKMESIGQLTGGVAHDFNNLLSVVLGSAEELRDLCGEEGLDFVDAIIRAVERGAGLTGQLLAFSRKQSLDPQPLRLDEAMGGFIDLLRRTLGENIAIETVTAAGLWACLVDRGQLENALLNLALNARDAMPEGGKLTIETRNVTIDEDYAGRQPEVTPGRYVLLAVSDTGTGIGADELAHVFEPFYSTKDADRGTGLGLSMVYGFVKQSLGHITIYSEKGQGTTVKMYLPATDRDVRKPLPVEPPVRTAHGETVLIVEDRSDVLLLVSRMVSDLGYRVVEATTGEQALKILNDPEISVDVLLSDVMLPGGMLGPDLVREAAESSPSLKVVYMTGYAENAVVHNGQLNRDVFVLQKPFRKAELATKLSLAMRQES